MKQKQKNSNKESIKQKSWFFEKISKSDRPLANLTKMRVEKTQISKIRNAKGEMKETSWKSRKSSVYFENFYCNKLESCEEMERFLDTYENLNLNQEDINHLNKSITQNVIEAAINKEPPKR
jgi:hypothetical protein